MKRDTLERARALGAWAYLPEAPLPGQADGTLAGLSFTAKDLYGVPGWPLRASTAAPLPEVGESPLVRTLLNAGATLLGKTHLHEIALGILGHNPVWGSARNPLDPERITGGSSSGAAIAAALGIGDFALGTDTGGSIRIPAALCGVLGFKPTYGLYPTEGVLPLSGSCDHAGPLARDLEVIHRVHTTVTGQTVLSTDWSSLRVGLWQVPGWMTPQTRAALDTFARRLEDRGAVTATFAFPDVMDTYAPVVQYEAARIHQQALSLEEPGFGPGTLALLRRGAALSEADYHAALRRRDALRAHLSELFGSFDLLLAPTVPSPAPLIGQEDLELPEGTVPLRQAFLRLTAPWSLLGVPVLSVPLPLGPLSVGAQLIAPWGQDARLLGLALNLEETV
ncbi:Asp-tRNA(Asn)/Glu-tRNA(Gln) amidotransferase A subunit family amidase [Deinobacterium chartae]|uniref:Asp-tRNA(Asn)/Glu-tRNA(Gln) amidotransferase A subunit family amidase n=1 Tax=Deinobacterium chartae TaxID=521158 RepID=A0A841I0F7_9DEIO|nr:amidase [Deinobacterium chartae]MBB6097930.1 Asp-tRNA(Asn)/Glu-tRNA(Gln) amidotransferase A subunit family amidase [Deinobacterium chartae]